MIPNAAGAERIRVLVFAAPVWDHAGTMRLPVSTTVYFRWQKVILYLESMEVVSASYLAKLYEGVSRGPRSI